MKNLMKIVALVLVLMLALSCAAVAEEKLSSRDTLKMGAKSEPTSMDPAKSKDLVTWMYVYNVADALVFQNPVTKAYEPNIATEWVVSEDGLEYNFTIREGVKFQNGDLMTADDVEYSLNRAIASSFTSQTNGCIDHFGVAECINTLCFNLAAIAGALLFTVFGASCVLDGCPVAKRVYVWLGFGLTCVLGAGLTCVLSTGLVRVLGSGLTCVLSTGLVRVLGAGRSCPIIRNSRRLFR